MPRITYSDFSLVRVRVEHYWDIQWIKKKTHQLSHFAAKLLNHSNRILHKRSQNCFSCKLTLQFGQKNANTPKFKKLNLDNVLDEQPPSRRTSGMNVWTVASTFKVKKKYILAFSQQPNVGLHNNNSSVSPFMDFMDCLSV